MGFSAGKSKIFPDGRESRDAELSGIVSGPRLNLGVAAPGNGPESLEITLNSSD